VLPPKYVSDSQGSLAIHHYTGYCLTSTILQLLKKTAVYSLLLLAAAPTPPPVTMQVLVEFLSALASLGVTPPHSLLTTLTRCLKEQCGSLTAMQLAAAMAALNVLQLEVDRLLLTTYFDRAAAAAVQASPADMAFVLQSLVAAGPAAAPPQEWLVNYLAAVRSKLVNADPGSLAGILWAAAKLGGQPPVDWVNAAVSRGRQLLGSNYMEAGKYLDVDFVPPLDLVQLSDAVWGLVKLGADRKQLQPLTNMLVSKTHDRLSQLSPGQLVGVTWAVSRCGVALTQKWVNQLGSTLGPALEGLTDAQLSDLLVALTWQTGCGAGAAAAEAVTAAAAAAEPAAAEGAATAAAAAAAAEGAEGAADGTTTTLSTTSSSSSISGDKRGSFGACSGSTTTCPDELTRPLMQQVNARLDRLTAVDLALTVHLLAHHDTSDVVPPPAVLQRYCADVAVDWSKQSNGSLVESAAAVAVLLQMQGGSTAGLVLAVQEGWLEEWLGQWAAAVADRWVG
jgi:hypothetical protein